MIKHRPLKKAHSILLLYHCLKQKSKTTQSIEYPCKARRHGLVVKGDDLQLRDCGFDFQHCILDGCKQLNSYYIIKKTMKIKVAKWGTPKKIFRKIECLCKIAIQQRSFCFSL
jgi:hypothetical protein